MPDTKDDENLIKLEKKIVEVHEDRITKNGTPYCALELETGDWVFVWKGHWKDEEIEPHSREYENLEAEIYVVDKSEEDDEDPWYHLKAVVPANPEKAEEMLTRRNKEIDEDEKDERRKLPKDAEKSPRI